VPQIAYSYDYLLWFSEEAVRLNGDTLPFVAPGHRGFTVRQPVGVCSAITPWNFPTAMLARKAAAALAAGCTMVAKPSEARLPRAPRSSPDSRQLTPLSALSFAELGARAGVPPGVFSVLTGEAAALGGVLCGHPEVRKLSFTGSTRVGKLLAAACASAAPMKRTSLELGGNAPFLVFDDADVAAAARGAVASKFRNAGQTCVCANRFYVQAGVYDAFAAALAAEMDAQLAMGDGAQPGVTLGPLINAAAVEKCARHVADAVARGAALVRGGPPPAGAARGGGHFFPPTLLRDVPPEAALCGEETFGPVAGLVRFEREEQALGWANASAAGLAGYVFTADARRLFRVAEALQVGMVGLNSGNASGAVAAPFGGVKDSGHGREGSRHALDEYTDLKYLSMAV